MLAVRAPRGRPTVTRDRIEQQWSQGDDPPESPAQDSIRGVLESGTGVERVIGGFGFLEGPIWHPQAHWLLFSDIARSRQYRWCEAAGLELFRTPSNQANGNAFDRDGRVVSCEHASSSVVRHEHHGRLVTPIATHYRRHALNSPNDIIVDSRGRIWFSDPTFGRTREDLGVLREPELDFRGVFRLDPDGTLVAVATDFDQPNGLCLSLDERRLFVNDTQRGHIRVFAVDARGSLTGGEVWARVEGEGEGVADGMKISTSGELLCNGPGGVHVYDADGRKLGRIFTPEKSTNFTFGDADRRTLYITASTSLYRVRLAIAGPPAFATAS